MQRDQDQPTVVDGRGSLQRSFRGFAPPRCPKVLPCSNPRNCRIVPYGQLSLPLRPCNRSGVGQSSFKTLRGGRKPPPSPTCEIAVGYMAGGAGTSGL